MGTRLERSRSLPLVVGGVEREYALLHPRSEAGSLIRLWICDQVGDSLELALRKRVAFIEHPEADGDVLSKYMLEDGGSIGLEDINLLEVSTPECYHGHQIAEYLSKHERLLADVLSGCLFLSRGLVISGGPSLLPGFEPGCEYIMRLGFHLNFAAHLTRERGMVFCSLLALLAPLLGGGGLAPWGFSPCPRALITRSSFRWGGHEASSSSMVERLSPRLCDAVPDIQPESRVHVSCVDAPLTRRGVVLAFESCRLLLAISLYPIGPLSNLRLCSPERAFVASSRSNAGARIELANGKSASLRELREALLAGLGEAEKMFVLKPAQGLALDSLRNGLRALLDGDFDYLASYFDAYLKRDIYRRLMEEEGVSLMFFERVALPAVFHASRLCSGLAELRTMSPVEVRSLLKKGHGPERNRRKLLAILARARLSPAELPSLAGLVHRMLTLEVRLHQLYPETSPLKDHEEELWQSFMKGWHIPAGTPFPTRASMRGELIKALGDLEAYRCRAEWSAIYIFSPHELVGVIALPDPYGRTAHFRWLPLPAEDSRLEDTRDLFFHLDMSRRFIFYPEGGKPSPRGGSLPCLPDGVPVLQYLRFGREPDQLELFGHENSESMVEIKGLSPRLHSGQLSLF